jgi:hypothetical protein
MSKELNGYDLSRAWFDFCFENPEKIKTNHTALYFLAIEHCNRLGWKEKFGLPTTMAMEAIGIKSYNTYINTLRDLVDWKFIKMIEVSKNQHSANIVALSNFNKALNNALDKAMIKHGSKQSESTSESTSESVDSIDKQRTSNQEQVTKNKEQKVYSKEVHDTFQKCLNYFPEHLHPNTEAKKNNWLDTLEKLERIDGLELDLIRKIVKKTRADDFWSKNFLSLTKLRKTNKEDITFIQVFYEKFKTTGNSKGHVSAEDMQTYIKRKRAEEANQTHS